MSANNACKLEFYFTRESIERLLKENPEAKGIIICQEIKVRHAADKQKLNVVEISARADNGKLRKKSMLKQVNGCPNPPGCGDVSSTEDVA
ncbi:hypothetical protein ABDK00_010090 [Niabella insulamsoli]|uniref:hypothetical protein n=1 Tax=Niabella insulamsoli TaxID=3144874 RepID=UPI0031FC6070